MRIFLKFLAGFVALAAAVVWLRYGGGEPYADLNTAPLLEESALEEVLSYAEPIGNVAVSAEGRVFFTVHPESRPQGNKLLEWVAGAAVPYPSGAEQPHLFNTVLGLAVDRQNRLWTIDHGFHGLAAARLLAFDLRNGNLVHSHEFRAEAAPAGSFLQDVQVSADGAHVFIADASFVAQRPAIVVYDTATRQSRRVLESHASVAAENYLIRTPDGDMSYLGGLVSLRGGVDGIAIDATNEWLYFAAINNDGLYRIPVRALTDATLSPQTLADRVEFYSRKPLSDGLSTDLQGNVYVTDVEHGAIFIVYADRRPRTLLRSWRIRWADALSFGPDGWLYIADSAMPDVVLRSKAHIEARAPYSVFRFRPGYEGIPGQ
ncbi:MAG: L-dopachrome tautomerase-related protein [Gammaproteobacteria bacterium]|nr:MAG: L-dopachrome tautomerase-related protein [Gammaproteobacteria bacterium]